MPQRVRRSGDAYSDRINTMPKYVVSTTLTDPGWANTTVLSPRVGDRIRELIDSTILKSGMAILRYRLA